MTARRLIEDAFANARAYPLWLRYVAVRDAAPGTYRGRRGHSAARLAYLAWRAAGGRV